MAECGRLVLLQAKVAGPCKTVANREEQQSVPGMAGYKCPDHDGDAKRGANRMQQTIARVAVLLQVEGEELVVRIEGTVCGHGTTLLEK